MYYLTRLRWKFWIRHAIQGLKLCFEYSRSFLERKTWLDFLIAKMKTRANASWNLLEATRIKVLPSRSFNYIVLLFKSSSLWNQCLFMCEWFYWRGLSAKEYEINLSIIYELFIDRLFLLQYACLNEILSRNKSNIKLHDNTTIIMKDLIQFQLWKFSKLDFVWKNEVFSNFYSSIFNSLLKNRRFCPFLEKKLIEMKNRRNILPPLN